MENIVQIAQEVIENDHFKFLLKDTIEHMMDDIKNKKQAKTNCPQYAQVSNVIDEINENLIALTQASIIQKSTALQLEIMKKNQQILSQQQSQMEMTFQSKLVAIKRQLIEEVKIQLRKQIPQTVSKKQILAQQRKVLGQSLLNCSNLTQKMGHKNSSVLMDQSMTLGEVSIDNILVDNNFNNRNATLINDLDITELNDKMNNYENSHKKITKEIDDIIKKKIELVQKDMNGMTDRIVDMKLKIYEKMEAGFSGLWNVVSNIENKLMKVTQVVADITQPA